jgi:hypothetical protein
VKESSYIAKLEAWPWRPQLAVIKQGSWFPTPAAAVAVEARRFILALRFFYVGGPASLASGNRHYFFLEDSAAAVCVYVCVYVVIRRR